MGLFDFKKPRWQHKDPAVRLAAVGSIDPRETGVLLTLSREDPDRDVRRAAINRLDDLAALSRLAADAGPEDLPVLVARKDTLLYQQILNSRDAEEWRGPLAQLSSPGLLAQLAVHGGQPDIRLAAVNRIEDQLLLAAIIKQNCGKKPALAALEKITDEGLLADLSETAASKTARRWAAAKIAAMEQQRNPVSDREIITGKLNALAAEAAQLKEQHDLEAAAQRLAAIREEWQELDREDTHPATEAFRKICTDFEASSREILERRKTGQEKAARFDRFQARLEELCSTLERLSCVTDDDAEAQQEQAVAEWEALVNASREEMVPSPVLAKRFAAACRAFAANRDKIHRERGLVEAIAKQGAETRELITAGELKKAALRLAEAEKGLARMKFNFFSKTAIDKLVADAAAELDRAAAAVREQNLSRRREICAQLEKLAQSEKHSHIEKNLQSLQQDWQQLAKAEGAEGEELEQRFAQTVAELTGKLKTLAHEQDWELWANLTLKEKLRERVIALDHEEDLETVVNVIRQAQEEWQTIGPVPPRESHKLWEEFHGACNRNFERASPFLAELKNRRAEAMARRREICALAGELAASNEWQQTTLTLKGLQDEWKTLPHGSRREEQHLFQQFREACDRFFARREEHYRLQDEERQQNLVAKEKLCAEAEQLAASPQPDYPGKFKRLQSEWKKIGPAPRKKEEAAWQRFRTACDTYFNWLAAEQQQNLARKAELCEAAEKLVAEATAEDDRKEIAAQLTALQQQWKEIGPVPHDQSEAIWQRFRQPCDLFFAARHQEYAREEEQRRANQEQKEEILARAEELAGRSKDRETAAQLQQLQKEWFEAGPAPREVNKELNERFKSLCNAFFEDRRQYFLDLKTEQLENQKKKESLCLRLENLLGLAYQPAAGEKGKALSLAEELKQAMENNFMLAGRRHEKKELNDEVKRIRQEWDRTGPVPPRQIRPLAERFRKALDAFYQSEGPPKTAARTP